MRNAFPDSTIRDIGTSLRPSYVSRNAFSSRFRRGPLWIVTHCTVTACRSLRPPNPTSRGPTRHARRSARSASRVPMPSLRSL